MLKKIVLLLTTVLFTYGIKAQFTLTGQVNDASTGKPLAGAHVVLSGHKYATITDESGLYSIRRIPAGKYLLKVTFVGYENYQEDIEVIGNLKRNVTLKPSVLLQEGIVVKATRAEEKTPVAFTNVPSRVIEKLNTGRDLPFLLDHTPSVVVTSDAGTGIGYTGIRVRGSDMQRLNVMINGVPLNDAESQLVYWVDIPEIASSTENIQIQRGAGLSAHGSGAFGGAINLQTSTIQDEAGARLITSGGSFGTLRNTLSFATGRLGSNFALEGRLSRTYSDGYIDRASAKLKSFFLTGGYFGKNNFLRFNIFGGKETTYQAWEGVPSELLHIHRTFNPAGMYFNENGDTLYYQNQVDDYEQNHYQLFYGFKPSSTFTLNLAMHYTTGFGYYESIKQAQKFSKYGLPNVIIGNDTLRKTDLISRKYLDNDFYGTNLSAFWQPSEKFDLTIGSGYTYYDGWHFGRIIWAQYASTGFIDKDYYRNQGIKKDFNSFARMKWQFAPRLTLMSDLQYRHVNYLIKGTHDDLRVLDQQHTFDFINPKIGITYQLTNSTLAYASVGIAHREPSRNEYRDADEGYHPRPEKMTDWELGIRHSTEQSQANVNLYLMDYTDQLVMTGKINNTGNAININVPESYRMGIELSGATHLNQKLNVAGHLTLSKNRIKNFVEYIDNWDTWTQEARQLGETNISFSPSLVGGATLNYHPVENMGISLSGKYVGKQYIDNTSSESKKLDPYWTLDFRADYRLTLPYIKNSTLFINIYNLLNHEYESNAWVYSYLEGGIEKKMDGYFPQAGIHFLAGLDIQF
ncbi:MAG: TonB-dependent receptor [Bacteroidales bacterium]|nr:TonB-dependent receptor [Bacteroidales bacterium]NPV36775.1 TonB-dependent receptor [Bacteroidales bacterium]